MKNKKATFIIIMIIYLAKQFLNFVLSLMVFNMYINWYFNYKKNKLKSLYIFAKKSLIDIKISIIGICYINIAQIPKTLMFSLRHE